MYRWVEIIKHCVVNKENTRSSYYVENQGFFNNTFKNINFAQQYIFNYLYRFIYVDIVS
jgi:hypothetical protein